MVQGAIVTGGITIVGGTFWADHLPEEYNVTTDTGDFIVTDNGDTIITELQE